MFIEDFFVSCIINDEINYFRMRNKFIKLFYFYFRIIKKINFKKYNFLDFVIDYCMIFLFFRYLYVFVLNYFESLFIIYKLKLWILKVRKNMGFNSYVIVIFIKMIKYYL